jgi:hypothetical protein
VGPAGLGTQSHFSRQYLDRPDAPIRGTVSQSEGLGHMLVKDYNPEAHTIVGPLPDGGLAIAVTWQGWPSSTGSLNTWPRDRYTGGNRCGIGTLIPRFEDLFFVFCLFLFILFFRMSFSVFAKNDYGYYKDHYQYNHDGPRY